MVQRYKLSKSKPINKKLVMMFFEDEVKGKCLLIPITG